MHLISVIWAFLLKLNLIIQFLRRKQHKLMSEPEICVLLLRENMFFLEKFTPLAKLLRCRRQWREWQISPLARDVVGFKKTDNSFKIDEKHPPFSFFLPKMSQITRYSRIKSKILARVKHLQIPRLSARGSQTKCEI